MQAPLLRTALVRVQRLLGAPRAAQGSPALAPRACRCHPPLWALASSPPQAVAAEPPARRTAALSMNMYGESGQSDLSCSTSPRQEMMQEE